MKPTRLALTGALAALAAGCMTAPQTPDEPVDRVVGEGGKCTTEGTSGFIGQRATTEIGTAIRTRTGADIFQWVPPETAVTMDYRQDRVRVSYDRAMTITQVSCG